MSDTWSRIEPTQPLHDEIAALRREIAAYRELPLVPIAEYQRVCKERDQYARAMDGLAAQVANASDKRAAVQLAAGIRAVHAMLRNVTGKVALGHDERLWVDEVKAWLAENGASVYGE